jgi:hypothetical protein
LGLEAHATALGKSLLAQLPSETARRLLGAQPYSDVLLAGALTAGDLSRYATEGERSPSCADPRSSCPAPTSSRRWPAGCQQLAGALGFTL